MRFDLAILFALTVPAVLILDVAIWILARERRPVRSALVAGLVVGKVAAGAAW